MMKTLVSIKDLSVRYGDYTALEDVSLDIYSDDFLGVIGPNGGGKTTLVKTILGALPYSGTVAYADSMVHSGRLRIGYLPQRSDVDTAFPISIREVVLSGLQSVKKIWSRYTVADRRRAEELLEMVGISGLAGRQIGSVSGGQMQRALLCRAIISNPEMLILDEPATYVDNKFEKELYRILQELSSRMAIVMVSHDLGTISSVVKNIICVNRHVHRHDSARITAEQLENYDCPIKLISHGRVPHTVLENH